MIKIRRWQGGGDNSPLIRLLVIRQAIVSGVGAVKVTDWPFWRLPSLQIGMFLITHEMKGCREEMVQNTQLFEYLMKAKKPCQDQTARLHFSQFFPTLIQNLHFGETWLKIIYAVPYWTNSVLIHPRCSVPDHRTKTVGKCEKCGVLLIFCSHSFFQSFLELVHILSLGNLSEVTRKLR